MNKNVEQKGNSGGGLSRRVFLAGAAGGLGGLALAGSSLSPATAAGATPTLPAEYYRKANQRTAAGTQYDNINVRINGDVARIFVPQTAKPGGAPVPVVWFYHGARTDHNALQAGFLSHSEAVVDRGSIAICQTAGGTLYSHPTAVALQEAGTAYMNSVFNISTNVLRATSAGGALAVETYARGIIANVAGLYTVNGTYDLRAHYDAGGIQRDAMLSAFPDVAAIDAANPARHAASAWQGKRLRVVVSTPNESDTTVPPGSHGLALQQRASSTAAEASVRTHTNGHSTPGFVKLDFAAAMDRWGVPDAPVVVDTQAPSVSLISPTAGQTIKGTVTARISATDNVGVVSAGIYSGTRLLAAATKYSASEWRVSFDTATVPNSAYTLTARASDAAGKTGSSSAVRVTIRN